MSSLRHREIGAAVRQSALTGQPVHITIDHRTYKVTCEQVDGPVNDAPGLDMDQAAALADIRYNLGYCDGQRSASCPRRDERE